MINQNELSITTRVAGTKFYTFNVPEIGDKVILLHNPFNQKDSTAIMVLNKQLQQLGHLTTIGGFNKRIGDLLKWQPHTATVTQVFGEFGEVFIKIDS